jgi:hypothetical protein
VPVRRVNADKDAAERPHRLASTAYPMLQETSPEQFAKMISPGDIVPHRREVASPEGTAAAHAKRSLLVARSRRLSAIGWPLWP